MFNFNKSIKEAFDFGGVSLGTTSDDLSAEALYIEENNKLSQYDIFQIFFPYTKHSDEYISRDFYTRDCIERYIDDHNEYNFIFPVTMENFPGPNAKTMFRQATLYGWRYVNLLGGKATLSDMAIINHAKDYNDKLPEALNGSFCVFISPDNGAFIVLRKISYGAATAGFLFFTGEVDYKSNKKCPTDPNFFKRRSKLMSFYNYIIRDHEGAREYTSYPYGCVADIIYGNDGYPSFIIQAEVRSAKEKPDTPRHKRINGELFTAVVTDPEHYTINVTLTDTGKKVYDKFTEGVPLNKLYKEYNSKKLQIENRVNASDTADAPLDPPEVVSERILHVENFKNIFNKYNKKGIYIANPCNQIKDGYGLGRLYCVSYTAEQSFYRQMMTAPGFSYNVLDAGDYCKIWGLDATSQEIAKCNKYNISVKIGDNPVKLWKLKDMPEYMAKIFKALPDVIGVMLSNDNGIIMFACGRKTMMRAKHVYEDSGRADFFNKVSYTNGKGYECVSLAVMFTGLVDYSKTF